MKVRLIVALLVLGSLAVAQGPAPAYSHVLIKVRSVRVRDNVVEYMTDLSNDSDETIYLPTGYVPRCSGIGWLEELSDANGKVLERTHPSKCCPGKAKLSVWFGVPDNSFELRPHSSISMLRSIPLEGLDARPGRYRLRLQVLGWTEEQFEALRLPGKLETLRGRPLIGKLDVAPFWVDVK